MRADGRPSGPQQPEQARVFFALWPDQRVRAGLHQAAVECARRFGGRATQPETLHLTLAFIGDVPVENLGMLKDAAAGVEAEAFGLTLDQLGYWGHNRILWAGSQHSETGLSRLVHGLAGRLQAAGQPTGLEPRRPFAPHITLVRKVVDQRPQLPELPPLNWDCREFALMRSRLSAHGAAYEMLERWSLS